jgi:CrcB protein
MMQTLLFISLGGALGAVARFGIGHWVSLVARTQFPWGILVVNLLGCLLVGLFSAVLVLDQWHGDGWRAFVLTGFLGGFTTLSAFSLAMVRMLQASPLQALAYLLCTSVGGVLLCAVGIFLAKWCLKAF